MFRPPLMEDANIQDVVMRIIASIRDSDSVAATCMDAVVSTMVAVEDVK